MLCAWDCGMAALHTGEKPREGRRGDAQVGTRHGSTALRGGKKQNGTEQRTKHQEDRQGDRTQRPQVPRGKQVHERTLSACPPAPMVPVRRAGSRRTDRCLLLRGFPSVVLAFLSLSWACLGAIHFKLVLLDLHRTSQVCCLPPVREIHYCFSVSLLILPPSPRDPLVAQLTLTPCCVQSSFSLSLALRNFCGRVSKFTLLLFRLRSDTHLAQ